ncbi:hypothetical protein JOM56_004774 [Amanita muscaria]
MPTTLRLNCLIEGEDIVFTTTAAGDDNVSNLKKSIQKERALDSLKDVGPHSLELWKVNIDINTYLNDRRSLSHLKLENLEPESIKSLQSWKSSSKYWSGQPPDEFIHIIVKGAPAVSFYKEPGQVLSIILPRPAGATITPSSSQNSNFNSPPSWLVDIHSELWGQRDLFGEIFRTATVTKGDFTELQDLLKALNPGRNADEYVPKDVLATKSAFLRERSTGLDLDLVDGLVPRPVLGACQPSSSDVVDEDGVMGDDNDVVDDDDDDDDDDDVMDDDDDDVVDGDDAAMVIDSDTQLPNEATAIFPYTIRYVDLTVLQSKEKLHVPRLMLFRNEWGTMIDIFNKRKKGMDGSALFSGQPGIGKTCMLHSILILCIILAQPIVFQDMDGMVFIIGNTVRPLGAPGVSDDADDVLTLVDADDTVCRPDKRLFRHKQYRILLTSSPKKNEDRRWLTQRVGDSQGMFMMMPWSREEFVVASLFLQSNDITLERLQEASCICGNIPRECFVAAVSPRLSSAKDKIRNAIDLTDNLSRTIINMKVGGETVIHRAFQIRPLYEDRLWNSCVVEPVSDWAFSEMMDVLDKRRAGSAYEFYCAIKGCRDGAALAGRTFENHLHKFLKTSSRTFTIESLDNRSATLEIRPLSIVRQERNIMLSPAAVSRLSIL